MRSVIGFVLSVVLALMVIGPAWAAAKASAAARVEGTAYIVCASDANYLACWSEQADGKSKLYIAETTKGDATCIATESLPGGIAWIPGRKQLLWCSGVYVDVIKATRVKYFIYDVASKENRKSVEVTDFSEAYQANPVAADDGSMMFHMTMDGNYWPSFNIYRPGDGSKGQMQMISSEAKFGSQYDLSSDGSRVYWILHDPKTSVMSIACWNLNASTYEALYEFPKKVDPADDHMFLKVDSTKHQAAAIVTSEKDPLLQLAVYLLDNLSVVPVHLDQGEQVDFFDWKGRSGTIYALVSNTQAKKFYIEEIDPLTGARRRMYETNQQMYSVDYAPDGTYYFTQIDTRDPKRPVTTIFRLK
jgi:hypothetical protein